MSFVKGQLCGIIREIIVIRKQLKHRYVPLETLGRPLGYLL